MSLIETFNVILRKAHELGASDVHICAGGPYRMRLRGAIAPVAGVPPLTAVETRQLAAHLPVQPRIERSPRA